MTDMEPEKDTRSLPFDDLSGLCRLFMNFDLAGFKATFAQNLKDLPGLSEEDVQSAERDLVEPLVDQFVDRLGAGIVRALSPSDLEGVLHAVESDLARSEEPADEQMRGVLMAELTHLQEEWRRVWPAWVDRRIDAKG